MISVKEKPCDWTEEVTDSSVFPPQRHRNVSGLKEKTNKQKKTIKKKNA
jgi:hypothetical protein